jgi:DNA-binding transcriptional LysR family regulator
MMIALPLGHKLAGKPQLPLVALSSEPLIMYPRANGSAIYDAIIAACQNCGFSPRVAQEAPQISSTLNLVAAGIGVALVPESMSHLQTHRVVYKPILGHAPRAAMSLAVRSGPISAAIEDFLGVVDEVLAEKSKTGRGTLAGKKSGASTAEITLKKPAKHSSKR